MIFHHLERLGLPPTPPPPRNDRQIAAADRASLPSMRSIRARPASLDAERTALEERLAAFERGCEKPIPVDRPPAQSGIPPTITTYSSTAEKVALFRRSAWRRRWHDFNRKSIRPPCSLALLWIG